jgi:hypothetical protein
MQHIEQMSVLSLTAGIPADLRVLLSRRLYDQPARATSDTRYTLIARDTSSAADFPEMAIKTPESGDKPDESR